MTIAFRIILAKKIDDPKQIKIFQGTWMPKERKEKVENADYSKNNSCCYKPCTSIFQSIAVIPNGDIYCCCGLTCLDIPFLKIGNIKTFTKKGILENQFNDLLKIWLYVDGPLKIADCVQSKISDIKLYPEKTAHNCEICKNIFLNSEVLSYIKDNINTIAPNIIFKYNTIIKTESL